MAITYKFFDPGDRDLIAVSDLPVEDGIAVAVRTTGYELGKDEIVEMSITDLQGNELLSHIVKPQNIEEWQSSDASGGLTPDDVADAPELYQFEDEIRELFENATIVVAQYVEFVSKMIEASWVALPDFKEFDIIEKFCASHCSSDYPSAPAAVATLEGVAGYYRIDAGEPTTLGMARTVAASYLKIVEEHAVERLGKGEQHWRQYEERLQEARLSDEAFQASKRAEEVKAARINAVLWLCAAAIFSNLAVQLNMRGADISLVIIVAAAAVFFAVQWALSLYRLHKLRKR